MSPNSLATLLRVISTPHRVKILQALLSYNDAVPSGTIAKLLGMDEGAASFNLTRMAEFGLVIRTPSGRYGFYSANRALIHEILESFSTKETM